MSDYKLPFAISNTMLELVSDISEKVGKVNSHKDLEKNHSLEETIESDRFTHH